MVSAATVRQRSLSPGRASLPPEGLRLADIGWRGHLLRVALFSLPFVALGLSAQWLGFLSDAHALVLAKALLAVDRGRLEVIGFVYPPLPFLLATVWPSAWTLPVLAGIAAGATAWLLWYDLRRTQLPLVIRTVLLSSVMLVPGMLFLATQSFQEILALHLLLVSWHYFLNFVRYGHTWSGFIAGLVLGLAFFASFYAVIFALAFALASPIYSRLREDGEDRSAPADLARIMVIAFPALWSLASWSYLNWVFTGNPLRFLSDPAVPVVIPPGGAGSLARALESAAQQTLAELLQQPLFLAVTILNLLYQRRRVVAFLSVPLILATIRSIGFVYGELFALGSYSLIALAGIPRRISLSWGMVLVAVALLQVVASARLGSPAAELADWQTKVTLGRAGASDELERTIAYRLAQAPPRSVLADDRSAYRMVARAGTARPFLLPADPEFASALEEPGRYVSYILVATKPAGKGDAVSPRFTERPPDGFVLDGAWPGWSLYRRASAPSLLSQP
jgi:hypothetical protein